MNTLLRSALFSPALLLAFVVTKPMRCYAAPEPATQQDAYADGTQAMNQQQWSNAIAAFDKVISAKSDRTDAALYWKAYSLNKLGNGPLALSTCIQLKQQFDKSTWNKDCSALTIDVNAAVNDMMKNMNLDAMRNMTLNINPAIQLSMDKSRGHDDPNEDIKILALNSLLRQDPAKALPILRDILTGNTSSESMKRHALFVLAQSKSPEAQSILHDALTGKMDPSLQRQAIESVAVFQGKRDNDALAEIYRATTDAGVKRAVINAFFITRDAPRLVDLARNEKDLETKRDIVSKLALMHDKAATDYMLELLK